MSERSNPNLLSVENLSIEFDQENNLVQAVDNVSFDLLRGEKLGIVGESGSGKSVTCLSILNLLEGETSARTGGSILMKEEDRSVDLRKLTGREIRMIRGKKISMVFQEPMSSFNPVIRCGKQVKEILDVHNILDESERKPYILNLFHELSLPEVERIYDSYPHELSGGQLQRINIAMALAPKPDIIICDEPTTALDVTVQKQIIELLEDVVKKHDLSLIFISHDLDVVAQLCDKVIVMYEGKVVESGLLPQTFLSPAHPYTQALLACKPKPSNRAFILPTVNEVMKNDFVQRKRSQLDVTDPEPVITIENLSVHFIAKKGILFGKKNIVKAVDDVSFTLHRNQSLGIVGESGSGKSTIANCISGLLQPTAGKMFFKDQRFSVDTLRKNKSLRRKIQLVFQDPYSSLNPSMTIGKAIQEPIRFHKLNKGLSIEDRMFMLLDDVGLDRAFANRYPHQLSGGQRQRVCIARALAVEPEILICDESVSALDVSVQAQILNLLDKLKVQYNLSLIFISHDLSVVYYICDQVIVLKEGSIVEEGKAEHILKDPQHSYTQELVNSIPMLN